MSDWRYKATARWHLDENVLRFDVSMHYPLRVQILDCEEHLEEEEETGVSARDYSDSAGT